MTAVARIWDRDFTLKFTLDEAPSGHIPEERIVTLSAEHEAAKWIMAGADEASFFALLTVDDENGRWCAPLDYWQAERVGSCPECTHCRQIVLRSCWRTPEPLRGHDFGSLVPS